MPPPEHTFISLMGSITIVTDFVVKKQTKKNKLLQIESCEEHVFCSSCKSLWESLHTDTGNHWFFSVGAFSLDFPHQKWETYFYRNDKNTVMENLVNSCLLISEK